MKFKVWLRQEKNMTYAEYKELDEIEQYCVWGDFISYNRTLQIREAYKRKKQKMIESGQIQIVELTPVEREIYGMKMEQERIHREWSEKAGGIERDGNYTALHHRWD